MYLDELKADLANNCGVDVSISTIWQAVEHCGLTLKKVCSTIIAVCNFTCWPDFLVPKNERQILLNRNYFGPPSILVHLPQK